MKFRTHNNAKINTNGTSLQGYIQATRAQLELAFGAPIEDRARDENKITTMWKIKFDTGEAVAIYDWKRYEYGAPKQNEIISWHIGAVNKRAVALVHEILSLK